ncbi:MAG TPA: phosphoenolpyruvate carboxykinase (ATP) [Thermoanaerobaculia bacterium]|nr:phosphoenolpyruvate carboxykinase (ATP) [Thermoanaerobaculia bacterium]
MSTVEAVNPKKITARKIHRGLSGKDLRELARREETTSAYGSPVYATRVKNRSAKDTYVVENGVLLGKHQKGMDPERAAELVRKLQESLADRELIQVDRRMGMAPEASLHCRLFVPVEFARIAAMWHNMLFPIDPSGTPDFVSVYIPDWPEKVIFLDANEGYTYICGTDYPGEAKESMLRQAMYWIKQKGGLGLHAGSKILRVTGRDGKLHDVGFLLFGLSGTGKTTLTLHDHGLEAPERVVIKQDDVVLLAADGRAFGTEDGFYIKTEGLEPSQRVLWDAAISPTACFENVRVRDDGSIDFCDTSLTSNGRGVVLRRFIHGTDDGIDLPKANKIVFITRRNDVVPVVARLTPEQGAAFFMLGESIETSAGDPTRAGQAKREVGTNPFIVGPEEEEGNRILRFLRDHSDMQAYLLNTGAIGARDGSPGEKITIRASSEIMKQIAKDGIAWQLDPDWGYQVPTSVPGVDLSKYDPRSHYSPSEYAARVSKLRGEREQWLAQFPGLDPSIPAAIEGRR